MPSYRGKGWILNMQDQVNVRRETFIANYKANINKYKEFAEYILKTATDALDSRQIDIAYATARAKTPESLEKKCKKKLKNGAGVYVDKYTDFRSEIMDLSGVRIVAYVLDDVKQISYIIGELFEILEEHSGNKLDLLGADRIGYLSVHYIVKLKEKSIIVGKENYKGLKCEIQVRTVLEDAWAQIFHDRQYKSELQLTDSEKLMRRTNLLSGNLELLDYQINALVKEYYRLNHVECNKDLKDILGKPVTKQNILSYIIFRFGKKTVFYNYERINRLLKSFGVNVIMDLEAMLKDASCDEKLQAYPAFLTADKMISFLLIISDSNKFFEEEGGSVIVSKESFNFLSEFVDIKKICDKHNVKIENGENGGNEE